MSAVAHGARGAERGRHPRAETREDEDDGQEQREVAIDVAGRRQQTTTGTDGSAGERADQRAGFTPAAIAAEHEPVHGVTIVDARRRHIAFVDDGTREADVAGVDAVVSEVAVHPPGVVQIRCLPDDEVLVLDLQLAHGGLPGSERRRPGAASIRPIPGPRFVYTSARRFQPARLWVFRPT